MEAKTATLTQKWARDVEQRDLLMVPGPHQPMVMVRVDHVFDGGRNRAGVETVQFQCTSADSDRQPFMIWRAPLEWMTVVELLAK